MLVRNRTAITPSPATIPISNVLDISNITPPLTNAVVPQCWAGSPIGLANLARQLAPQTYVGNSLLVARDDHFAAFGNSATIFAARPADPAGSHLRVDNLAGSAGSDGTANTSQNSNHVVVGRIHVLFVRDQHLGQ